MERGSYLVVIVLGSVLGTSVARADDTVASAPANPRRRIGTRTAYAGLTATLAGVALGAFSIGLGNDRPDAAKPFYVASGISLGGGAILLTSGLYVRATSPEDPPDAISLAPVRSRHRTERRAGIVIGGLGASILVTGIAHAIGAYRDYDLSRAQCPNDTCTEGGARLLSRSHTLGHAAEILIGTGAIGVAGGIILYRGGRDRARVVPVVGPQQVTAAVVGQF